MNNDTYDKWSLRACFTAAATAVTAIGVGVAFSAVAPAVASAGFAVAIVAGVAEGLIIMHGVSRSR